MSAEAVGWVYRHSPMKGAAFVVHLAIADSVSDLHHHEFWMAQANLATKCRLEVRTVRRAIDELHEHGFIEPLDPELALGDCRQRAGYPIRWVFLYPEVPVVYAPRPRTSRPGYPGQDVRPPRTQCPTPPDTVSDVTQEEPKKNRARRPMPIAEDWEPSERILKRCTEFHPELDPWPIAREFRSYWLGRGDKRADWDWTFYNRVQQVAARSEQRGPARTFL